MATQTRSDRKRCSNCGEPITNPIDRCEMPPRTMDQWHALAIALDKERAAGVIGWDYVYPWPQERRHLS